MPSLRGVYQARRQRRPYSYEVQWHAAGGTAVWEAKVRVNGALVGLPRGEAPEVTPQGVEGAVRKVIDTSIDPYSIE
jgi:hypothetical protein